LVCNVTQLFHLLARTCFHSPGIFLLNFVTDEKLCWYIGHWQVELCFVLVLSSLVSVWSWCVIAAVVCVFHHSPTSLTSVAANLVQHLTRLFTVTSESLKTSHRGQGLRVVKGSLHIVGNTLPKWKVEVSCSFFKPTVINYNLAMKNSNACELQQCVKQCHAINMLEVLRLQAVTYIGHHFLYPIPNRIITELNHY